MSRRTHNGAKPWLRRCTSPHPHATRTHTARSATPCAALWHAARLLARRRHHLPPTHAVVCMRAHTTSQWRHAHTRAATCEFSPRRPPQRWGASMVPLACVPNTQSLPPIYLTVYPTTYQQPEYIQFYCTCNYTYMRPLQCTLVQDGRALAAFYYTCNIARCVVLQRSTTCNIARSVVSADYMQFATYMQYRTQ